MFNTQNVGQILPSINLENIDYRDHKMILTSPRSLAICKQNNVNMEDLYFYNFFEYREIHPDIITLKVEQQHEHYESDKKYRENLISKLIQERRALIKKENEKNIEQKKNNEKTEIRRKK